MEKKVNKDLYEIGTLIRYHIRHRDIRGIGIYLGKNYILPSEQYHYVLCITCNKELNIIQDLGLSVRNKPEIFILANDEMTDIS